MNFGFHSNPPFVSYKLLCLKYETSRHILIITFTIQAIFLIDEVLDIYILCTYNT